MTQKSILKISLTVLALSLILLIGVTYAWFSAEVVSSNNIIKVGNLGVSMDYSDGSLDEAGELVWADVEVAAEPMFNLDYLEPGFRAVRYLKISNTGNLAFQCQLDIISDEDLLSIGDVVDVYLIDNTIRVLEEFNPKGMAHYRLGTLREVVENQIILDEAVIFPKTTKADSNLNNIDLQTREEKSYATLVLRMIDDGGNMAMGEDLKGGFDVRLLATQISFEKDGIDNTYDLGAKLTD